LIKKLFFNYFEPAFWTAVLISLAFANPAAQPHFALCPLKLLGFTWCPGCGLGHSISWLFHGDIKNSFHAHWLGIPTVLVILHRIYTVCRQRLSFQKPFPMPQLSTPNN